MSTGVVFLAVICIGVTALMRLPLDARFTCGSRKVLVAATDPVAEVGHGAQ